MLPELMVVDDIAAGRLRHVLAEYQALFHFTGVAIQPGKPLVFGEAKSNDRRVPFFGLPGNPVSTMVTFELFVRPVVDVLSGGNPSAPKFLQARLKGALRTKTGLTRFLPGRLDGEGYATEVEFANWHGSGDVVSAAASNCYIVVPPDREDFTSGEMVNILLSGARF